MCACAQYWCSWMAVMCVCAHLYTPFFICFVHFHNQKSQACLCSDSCYLSWFCAFLHTFSLTTIFFFFPFSVTVGYPNCAGLSPLLSPTFSIVQQSPSPNSKSISGDLSNTSLDISWQAIMNTKECWNQILVTMSLLWYVDESDRLSSVMGYFHFCGSEPFGSRLSNTLKASSVNFSGEKLIPGDDN